MREQLTADLLVVGGGTGGTCAAIQAARRGANTILVSAGDWLGGMLTAAGVSVPDGHELTAWQTGLWGAYLAALRDRQPGGLDHSWVSLFSYEPRIGAAIFADWVAALPNLHWIRGQEPTGVERKGDRITAVNFPDYRITASITLDGTELGDLLALGDVPHRWGWELQSEFNEPSAPPAWNDLTDRYPVQSPTWVAYLQDYGANQTAPAIPCPTGVDFDSFRGAWANYGGSHFLDYGRLPGGQFMLNWPIQGNDYGVGLERLIASDTARAEFGRAAQAMSLAFAHHIQAELGDRYGLAAHAFPNPNNPALALQPYYRESRRLRGLTTITEADILPQAGESVAALPIAQDQVQAIAFGNYANDHHYPGFDFPLQPKSIQWGGRWTGTPFTIPYGAIVPEQVRGLLVCEKNISVSHIANGSTRLQPMVMGIGQAAGMAAALCVERGCDPVELAVRSLQEALIGDAIAPAAVVPLFNLPPNHPHWGHWQRHYLDQPDAYPADGNAPIDSAFTSEVEAGEAIAAPITITAPHQYHLTHAGQTWQVITTRPEVKAKLQTLNSGQSVHLWGRCNPSGRWIVVEKLDRP
ncbi:FAD-dependent oxidoreductase [Spirulina major]|uniref:FAD-dependent oxidoreductase n=1 Tax=Spirulina major TaxID=270636 RepID=UPI0009350991|nr:FAD-dependent oxidoreductase [Spirulina major]